MILFMILTCGLLTLQISILPHRLTEFDDRDLQLQNLFQFYVTFEFTDATNENVNTAIGQLLPYFCLLHTLTSPIANTGLYLAVRFH